jgi:hypothetical protein
LVIWVNGRPAEYMKSPAKLQMFSEYAFGSKQAGCTSPQSPTLPSWDRHEGGASNSIRLGEVSDLGSGPFPRNQSADMTLDEFHLWRIETPFKLLQNGQDLGTAYQIQYDVINARNTAINQWKVGRYYRPRNDAVFTSAPISMNLRDRSLAAGGSSRPKAGLTDVATGPGVSAPAPYGGGTTTETGGVGISTGAMPRRTALMGFAWTWIPEEVSRKDGNPIILDYRPKIKDQYGAPDKYTSSEDDDIGDDEGDAASDVGFSGAGAIDLAPSKSSFKWNEELQKLTPLFVKMDYPQCTIELRVLGPEGDIRRTIEPTGTRGFTSAGWSDPRDGRGRPYELESDESLQYLVRFNIDGLQTDSALLGTPVFDDITFYFQTDIEYLSWSSGEATK